LLVPRYRSYEVALLAAVQLKVGVVDWLVAPLAGDASVTCPGTEPEPTDLNVRIKDAQIALGCPESNVAVCVPLRPVRVVLSSTAAKLAKNRA
jgi:hypothetical protein